MFLVGLFTVFDFLVMVVMILTQLDVLGSWRLLIGGTAWFVTKAFLFRGDIFSLLDLLAGINLILLLLGVRWFITWIFVIYLAYKVVMFLYGTLFT